MPYLVVIIISLCLSSLAIYNTSVINFDAVCYLHTAQMITEHGVRASMNLCGPWSKWPFYSILIAGVAQLTKISYIAAAHGLDALFTAITAVIFVYLVRQLGGSTRTLWYAVIILVGAHDFNVTKQYIVRDHGFWAAYLLSLVCLLRYLRSPTWWGATLWSVSLLLATLFRIEGVLVWLFWPWCIFLRHDLDYVSKLRCLVQLLWLLMAGATVILLWLVWHPEISVASLGRVQELLSQLLHGSSILAQQLQIAIHEIANKVLPIYSRHYAGLVLVLMLLILYLVYVVKGLSFLYTFLAVYTWRACAVSFDRNAHLALLGYIAITATTTLVFLAEQFFLSQRYLVALIFTIMLYLPFGLECFVARFRKKVLLVSVLILYLIVHGVLPIVQPSHAKQYINQAGQWLAQHIHHAKLYTNDMRLLYYSRMQFHDGDLWQQWQQYDSKQFIKLAQRRQWCDFDYLAIHVGQHVNSVRTELRHPEVVKRFANDKGQSVTIYRIKRHC